MPRKKLVGKLNIRTGEYREVDHAPLIKSLRANLQGEVNEAKREYDKAMLEIDELHRRAVSLRDKYQFLLSELKAFNERHADGSSATARED